MLPIRFFLINYFPKNKVGILAITFLFIFSKLRAESCFKPLIEQGLFKAKTSIVSNANSGRNLSQINDTSNYTIALNMIHNNPSLFNKNTTYFIASNAAILNSMNLIEIDLLFKKFNQDSLRLFINQHSSVALSQITNAFNLPDSFSLSTGETLKTRKEDGLVMITDEKKFESIVEGHIILNNCSFFLIQLLLR